MHINMHNYQGFKLNYIHVYVDVGYICVIE